MRNVKSLAEKTNYLNKDILYLRNTTIQEYDIKSAGFTVIKSKKLLPPEEIQMLETIDKEARNIHIGKRIIRFPKISEEIINTLAEVRQDFFILNNIQEDEILSIKKDAVFLIKKVPEHLIIGDFEFRQKSSYTSYCYINKVEFYYDALTETFDIKGLPEDAKKLQEEYLIKDIKRLIALAEKLTPDKLFILLKQYRSKYLKRQLDPATYRDLNTGRYSVGDYFFDAVSQEELKEVVKKSPRARKAVKKPRHKSKKR